MVPSAKGVRNEAPKASKGVACGHGGEVWGILYIKFSNLVHICKSFQTSAIVFIKFMYYNVTHDCIICAIINLQNDIRVAFEYKS